MNPLLGAMAAWGWAEAPQSPDRTRVRFKGMGTAAPLSPDRVRIARAISFARTKCQVPFL